MNRSATAVAVAAALLLPACAGAPRGGGGGPAAHTGVAPFADLAVRFTDRAFLQERDGDPRGALGSWRIAAELQPGLEEPRQRAADLEARLAGESARRYLAGLERLEDGRPEDARRELLLALAADPDHAGALDALRNRVSPDAVAYTVAEGDSLEWIARKFYTDPGKAPIIARVNDLAPGSRPAPGSVLAIPVLPPPGAAGKSARRGAVSAQDKERAEELYNEGVSFFVNQRLDDAIRSWEETLDLNPEHPRAAADIGKARELQKKLREIR